MNSVTVKVRGDFDGFKLFHVSIITSEMINPIVVCNHNLNIKHDRWRVVSNTKPALEFS